MLGICRRGKRKEPLLFASFRQFSRRLCVTMSRRHDETVRTWMGFELINLFVL